MSTMHFCSNCGTQIDDNIQFCPSCGSKQIRVDEPQQTSRPEYQPPVNNARISDWDGSVLDTIVNSIIAGLIITFTCGIATPWAICYIYKFVISHVIVDGKRLKFDGTGGALFANWIKWFILILITCGIYSFWVTPRLYKWIAGNTHFE